MSNPSPKTLNDLLLSDPTTLPPTQITRFRGPYEFLSNFYPKSLEVNHIRYLSAEQAYQAGKAKTRAGFERVMACPTPGEAKRIGRTVEMREGWDRIKPDGGWPLKADRMLEVLRAKFENPFMRDLLLLTGEAELIEGNEWGDRYWGCVWAGGKWEGENMLGHLLMLVREELRSDG